MPIRYFRSSILFSICGLLLAFYVGYLYEGTFKGAFSALFITLVLSVLEVSISFDNAVVNASVLKDMTPIWQRRFLTWGILIAVFGMRLIFPLAIVSIAAATDPWSALQLAATSPDRYAEIMLGAHIPVSAFGGSFLLMVALKYFFDHNKDVHWLRLIEAPLVRLGKMEAIEAALVLLVLLGFYKLLPNPEDALRFFMSGVYGLILFIFVDGLGSFLEVSEDAMMDVHKSSAASFLYLEVLDASFSFDGVVGAFAITHNLFIIAIGLGIGAMFVRSLTILLVEKNTLSEIKYLEHGAFYAIFALATIMLMGSMVHIPEVITGLIGVVFIGFSIYQSLREKRQH